MHVEELMAAYVARDLSEAQAAEVAAHISTCESCQQWYEEVLSLFDIWQDETPIQGLDLASPVLRQVVDHAANSVQRGDIAQVASNETSVIISATQRTESKYRLNLRATAFVHYGVAASITIVLFQLGAFEHLGSLATHGKVLSTVIQHLFSTLSSRSF